MITRRSFLKFVGLGAAAPVVAKAAPAAHEYGFKEVGMSISINPEMKVVSGDLNEEALECFLDGITEFEPIAGERVWLGDIVVMRDDGLMYRACGQEIKDQTPINPIMVAMRNAEPGQVFKAAMNGSFLVRKA